MLKIRGLNSGYEGSEILHEIDFEANPAEIIAIIGPNGAGKSTLLKSIFNLCEIYSGKINFRTKNITKLPTHDLIYEGISYVPQGRQVFSDLTVKENLEMGAFIIRDKELIKRNLNMVFDNFPFLKMKKDDYAFTLSGGQQQMLAIGRALMGNPKILLLDEPSLGLAPIIVRDIFNILKRIKEEGRTILIVEQNAFQTLKIADYAYVLELGKIISEGTGEKLLNDDQLINAYLGSQH